MDLTSERPITTRKTRATPAENTVDQFDNVAKFFGISDNNVDKCAVFDWFFTSTNTLIIFYSALDNKNPLGGQKLAEVFGGDMMKK